MGFRNEAMSYCINSFNYEGRSIHGRGEGRNHWQTDEQRHDRLAGDGKLYFSKILLFNYVLSSSFRGYFGFLYMYTIVVKSLWRVYKIYMSVCLSIYLLVCVHVCLLANLFSIWFIGLDIIIIKIIFRHVFFLLCSIMDGKTIIFSLLHISWFFAVRNSING